MKKTLVILAAILTGFSFTSCEKPAAEPTEKVSVIKNADLSIPAKGGCASIEMVKGVSFTSESDASWLSVSCEAEKVVMTADANMSIQPRYASVFVKTADETLEFSVMQFGFRSVSFSAPDKVFTSASGEFSFEYEYDELMQVSTDASWVTAVVTENSVTVTVSEDTAEATASDRQRVAELKWSLGAESGVIKLTQHHKNFMALDSNWEVSYLGVQKYQGEDVEEIQNTVTDPKVSVPYAIYALPKAKLGSVELASFVETELPSILKSTFDEYIQLYAAMGLGGLTYSDFLYEGTDFEIFDIFEPGDYYGIAIGLDENCEAVGAYQFCEFTKTAGSGDDQPKGYDAWLGEWKVNHGTSTTKQDTWKFSENVKGESYWITGIEGFDDIKVECAYDNATGGITVVAQEGIAEMEVGTKGMCSIGFYGALASGNFWRPGTTPYTVFTGTVSGNTAQLVPGTVKTSDGEVNPELATFIATTPEEKFTLIHSFSDATRIPATLSRDGNGGGDNGGGNQGGSGSEAYNKFIAGWQGTPEDPTADAWVADFQQLEADKTVAIYGWEGWDDDWVAPITANFSSEGASLTFKGGTGEPLANNVDIGAPEGAMNIYYMGSALIDGQSYVITSGTSMYDACKAVVDGSSLKITGLDVKLSDGGTYPFVEFGIVAMDAATGGNTAIYTFKTSLGEFPYTLGKSGASSVKVMGRTFNLSMENAVRIDRSHVLKAVVSDDCQPMKAVQAIYIPAKISKHLGK